MHEYSFFDFTPPVRAQSLSIMHLSTYPVIFPTVMLQKIIFGAVNQLPALLKHPIQYLPFELYRKPLQYALQQLLAEQLREGELDFLEERWLQVKVTDLAFSYAITVEEEKLIVAPAQQQADVTFAGNSQDLLLVAARKQDPDTLFFRRKLAISGDTELGLAIKNLMDSIDWEQMPNLVTKALETSATLVEKAQSYQESQLNNSLA